MINTLIRALLLCSLCWRQAASASESQTVEVRPGEEATLLCANISRSTTHTFWSRLVNRTKISCISSMYGSNSKASSCDGFQNGKFEMSANISSVFLKIQHVDISDSGMYFCGFYIDGHTEINVKYLNVKGNNETHDAVNEKPDLTRLMMGALIVFLIIVIIGLVVKIWKLQTAHDEEHEKNPRKLNLSSDDLIYAAPSFHQKSKRNRRPGAERELETNVVYTAIRQTQETAGTATLCGTDAYHTNLCMWFGSTSFLEELPSLTTMFVATTKNQIL
ncbi:uncharacterized protein LOC123979731 [Micropterus dolomieu]|uniref:uncharacterized protein LOC123979731 n=1 Tax=Micropterus dolomieu TaxID=147949 RepID=UPI001E8D4475|nr:uncharacterized protein LOC123979731 [Micropterus dolomieu]